MFSCKGSTPVQVPEGGPTEDASRGHIEGEMKRGGEGERERENGGGRERERERGRPTLVGRGEGRCRPARAAVLLSTESACLGLVLSQIGESGGHFDEIVPFGGIKRVGAAILAQN